ncbi:MAG: hypothetical protein AAGM22_21380 [Acidobacteriota bacterium]
MVSRPIKNLLTGLIDYAGLFPPSKLPMDPAVTEFTRQRASREAFVLGRFVVPAARLGELETSFARSQAAAPAPDQSPSGVIEGPWRLSVLAGGDMDAARAQIDAFNARNAGQLRADAIETKPASASDIAHTSSAFGDFDVFYELPYDRDPSELMASVAEHGGFAKIRTGGITADAFPQVAQVAEFLFAAHRAGIAFKATAGLHHALRGEYRLTYEEGCPSGTMHGFLNLFLAAAFVRQGLAAVQVKELLAERSAGVLDFSAAGVSWRGERLMADDLAATRREFALSYGSCSIAEPVEDLHALRLL